MSEYFTKSKSMPLQPTDSLHDWIEHYLSMAVHGVRSEGVHRKIRLHLNRCRDFFVDRYGQEHLSSWVKRDIEMWCNHLVSEGFAPATINNHLASLSGFASWIDARDENLFSMGNPTRGVGELPLPPLEPRALDDRQVQSLKNLCDRLLPYYRSTSRRWLGRESEAPL